MVTRNNYETFFLLYVDNELSPEERKSVELFIQENEDLSQELEALKLTQLPTEEQVFIPKTFLYRNATEVENVQQSLLLHLDGELSPQDIVTVEGQIKNDRQVEEEWKILKQTKLYPELIPFPNKEILYRYAGRVVDMNLVRRMAAVVTGIGLFFAAALLFNTPDEGSVAVIPTPIEQTQPFDKLPTTEKVVSKDEVIRTGEQELIAQRPKVKPAVAAVTELAKATDKSIIPKNNIAESNLITKSPVKQEMKAVETELEESNIKPRETELAVFPVKELPNTPITDTEIAETKQQFAKLALNEESNSDRILYFDEDKLSRTKLAGMFRKVKRVVERNTKIKTPKGFRIGGFEIAVN